MATIYFTNNADSGDGTLRQAITDASPGDVIMPRGFGSGNITIALSSYLPIKSITLDGGENFVILHGQRMVDFFRLGSASADVCFRKVAFVSGARTASAPFNCSAFNSLTFDRCYISGCSGSYSGFIYVQANAAGVLTFSNCVAFGNSVSVDSRGTVVFAASSSRATIVVSGCTFAGSVDRRAEISDNGQTTVVGSIVQNINGTVVDLSGADFVGADIGDYRLGPNSEFLTGGSTLGHDFLGHSRTGAVGAYSGSWFAVQTNGYEIVAGGTVVDRVELCSGSTVAFADDGFLTATLSADVADATVELMRGGNGYFATPAGTDLDALTVDGVNLLTSGTRVSAFDATIDKNKASFSVSKTGPSAPIIEGKTAAPGAAWSELTVVKNAATLASAKSYTFRAFDGYEFKTTSVVPRVYYYAGDAAGGSFATAADWALDSSLTLVCADAPTIAGCSFYIR